MELPADVEYVEDANLFIWRPRGVLSEALVNQISSIRRGAGRDARPAV